MCLISCSENLLVCDGIASTHTTARLASLLQNILEEESVARSRAEARRGEAQCELNCQTTQEKHRKNKMSRGEA